jgi:hypothetical protein
MRAHFSLLAAIVVLSGRPSTSGLDQPAPAPDLKQAAAGLHELFLHDPCTADYPPQPDTCLHKQLLERAITFGGKRDVVHDVTLRIRGIFEPTTIEGGETPYPDRPYYRVGGTIAAKEWSAWHIEVSNPKQTYWLNHYPRVGHTIYNEDFEATIPVTGGAAVAVRVIDGNGSADRQRQAGAADRLQIIKGVVDTPLGGQMLRLDVVRLVARP